MSIRSNMGDINDGGGYDLDELKYARKNLDAKANEVSEVPKDVAPEYIQVRDGVVVSTKEMGQREVFLDLDENDEVIGVELL